MMKVNQKQIEQGEPVNHHNFMGKTSMELILCVCAHHSEYTVPIVFD